MTIGYIRVSTAEQNTVRQEVLMDALGAERVFIDRMSGGDTRRPQLKAMLEFAREGDAVVVESISRFARNTKDLLQLIETLEEKKVRFVSRKEAIDTSTPSGRFMLTVFGAVAELERDYIRERQREGIAEARKAGKYRGRKPIAMDHARFETLYRRWKAGELTATAMRRTLGLSSSTFYRKVREFEAGE